MTFYKTSIFSKSKSIKKSVQVCNPNIQKSSGKFLATEDDLPNPENESVVDKNLELLLSKDTNEEIKNVANEKVSSWLIKQQNPWG